jgi:predicted DsbA family dithiol-disulfide isomerase
MLFFFDYADPLSWTIEVLARQTPAGSVALERFPFDSGDLADGWEDRVTQAGSILQGLGVGWSPPESPVRSQKAFELAFHAAESGCFDRVHAAIFIAHFGSGRDIGRIDELLQVAVGEGLDPSETKAVLDVDRHAEAVMAWRERAVQAGVNTTPTLASGEIRSEGIVAIEKLQRALRLKTRED